jgi:hypothetical protein
MIIETVNLGKRLIIAFFGVDVWAARITSSK